MTTRPVLASVKTDIPNAPPHNLEAEQALLGVLLVDNQIYFKVFELVAADDFYDPVHERIFAAIGSTIEAGRVADARTLRGVIDKEEALKPIGGGAKYLAELTSSVVTTFNALDYARYVHELATRRRLIAYSNDVRAIALDQNAPPESGEQLVGMAETKLFALAERKGREGAIDSAAAFQETIDKIDDVFRRGGPVVGVPTGLSRLTHIIGGFQPGNLYTIAGRPSMGKTAIGLTLAANAAAAGARVVFHSLEMERTDIMARLIARICGIPANKQCGQIGLEDFQKIEATRAEIQSWPLYIDDGSRLKVAQIRGRAIRQKRRFGLDMLVIDYLGLLAPSDPKINRNYQIEEMTVGLKSLAKELKIPVLLLAQLNREVEKRDNKRPGLSDLRDSGSIEQDSDVVGLLYRHEYYITKAEPMRNDRETDEKYQDRYDNWQKEVEKSRGRGELIIAKHRQGETGVVPLHFMGWKCLFVDETGNGDGAT